MSQILDAVDDVIAPTAAVPEKVRVSETETADVGYGEFDYSPMPVLAPISAVLGICSLIAFLGLFGIVLAIVGIMASLVASWTILRSQGAYSGIKVALAGLVLSLASAIGGIAVLAYNYKHELPEGFERVSFTNQISKTAFLVENGVRNVHPNVQTLVDKPIFVKGFMYPTGQEVNLSGFLLLKDSGQCCFGGQPALEDMIGVQVPENLHVDYYAGRVAVAGTFKINPEYTGADSLEPLFILDAAHFSRAKTSL